MTTHMCLAGIEKAYGATPVLSDISINIERGSFVVLLGPSGCGKSTLLRIVAGLLKADEGRIVLDGDDITEVPAWDRDIGLVFQNYALFPHMSVAQNVAFGLTMRNLPKVEIKARVAAALDAVRLSELGDRKPADLSGGQQQRVAVARAIVIRPRLLLLDEPLSNLDAVLRASVRSELRELHDRTGITTIMVTHDQAEALSIADRVVLMSEGKVVQDAPPEEIYRAPATAFAASFVGSPPANLLRILPGAPGWHPPDELSARLRELDAPVLLATRPEAIRLSNTAGPHALPGRLRRIEFQGADRLAHVDVMEQTLIVRLADGQTIAGPDVWLELLGKQQLFDALTGLPTACSKKGDINVR